MNTIASSSSRARNWPELSFVLLCLVSIVFWFRDLTALLKLAVSDERYTHLFLVLPLSALLIYLQRNSVRLPPRRTIWAAGFLIFSVVLAELARIHVPNSGLPSDVRLTVSVFALVVWWIGSFVLCFGLQAFQALSFPLLFLLWMVPLPSLVLDVWVGWWQRGSAISAEMLFRLIREPATLSGMVLSLPGLDLEVAPECSSIRSSLILIVTTMALAQILLRSPWRKIAVIALAFPLSIAKNGLRIFVLGWIATHGDPDIFSTRLHTQGGVVFLSVAFAIVFVLAWILRRDERKGEVARMWTTVG